MQPQGISPSLATFHSLLKGTSFLDSSGLRQLYSQMLSLQHISPTDVTFHYVFRAAARCCKDLPAAWLFQVSSSLPGVLLDEPPCGSSLLALWRQGCPPSALLDCLWSALHGCPHPALHEWSLSALHASPPVLHEWSLSALYASPPALCIALMWLHDWPPSALHDCPPCCCMLQLCAACIWHNMSHGAWATTLCVSAAERNCRSWLTCPSAGWL